MCLQQVLKHAIQISLKKRYPMRIYSNDYVCRICSPCGASITWYDVVEGPLPFGFERRTRYEWYVKNLEKIDQVIETLCVSHVEDINVHLETKEKIKNTYLENYHLCSMAVGKGRIYLACEYNVKKHCDDLACMLSD